MNFNVEVWKASFAIEKALYQFSLYSGPNSFYKSKGGQEGKKHPLQNQIGSFQESFNPYLSILSEDILNSFYKILKTFDGENETNRTKGTELLLALYESVKTQLEMGSNKLENAKDCFRAVVYYESQYAVEEYEALLSLQDEIKDMQESRVIPNLISFWNKMIRKHLDYQQKDKVKIQVHGVNYFFWQTSDSHEFNYNAVIIYRVIEDFQLRAFEQVAVDIIKSLKEEELDLTDLFYISKSRFLKFELASTINHSLNKIGSYPYTDEGFCYKGIDNEANKIPDLERTLYFIISVYRLSNDASLRFKADKALQWVFLQFRGSYLMRSVNGIEHPSVYLTILALQSVKLSSNEKYNYHIKDIENWILSQQNENGVWEDKIIYGTSGRWRVPVNYLLITADVLQYFESKTRAKFSLSALEEVAVNFIGEALRLSRNERL